VVAFGDRCRPLGGRGAQVSSTVSVAGHLVEVRGDGLVPRQGGVQRFQGSEAASVRVQRRDRRLGLVLPELERLGCREPHRWQTPLVVGDVVPGPLFLG
jgi:hypothetical protein